MNHRATGPRPGHSCYRIAPATRATVIVDADGYFGAARAAMIKAKKRIVLIGWDFDARIKLCSVGADDDGAPTRVGDFIYWLVERNPDLDIYLLRWDVGALKTLVRGSTVFTLMKWMAHERIHTKLDSVHPHGASHHQKIVVIDEAMAFCGGIDMTRDRWDTREHIHKDPRRLRPSGKLHKPWHDATTALEGPVAKVLADVTRNRWKVAGGKDLEPLPDMPSPWPEHLPTQFTNVPVAVSRSAPAMDEREAVREIEQLYIEQIASARSFIYAESQYFASRRVAEAMAARLSEPNGPEIVLINPDSAEGWLEPIAMDTARARLREAIRRRDPHGRFRIYHPVTSGGEPIYSHAKILIVDDRILRVGSSNMNNRSMRLDTECDVTIDVALTDDPSVSKTITRIRDDLLGEHLGMAPAHVTASIERHGSLIKTIEDLRGKGKTLVPYETPDLSAVEAWLADNEVLDPEGAEEMFEAIHHGSLFRPWSLLNPPW